MCYERMVLRNIEGVACISCTIFVWVNQGVCAHNVVIFRLLEL